MENVSTLGNIVATVLSLLIPASTMQMPAHAPRTGVNFIPSEIANVQETLDDLSPEMAIRQLTGADVTWATIQPTRDAWDFSKTDSVLLSDTRTQEPVVTLFSMYYPSPNAPWSLEQTPFATEMTPEAQEYIEAVVTRYKDAVTYWEIGNEWDVWQAVSQGTAPDLEKAPANAYQGLNYTPEQQGKFIGQVATLVKELDPNAVIVLGGMHSTEYAATTWLSAVAQNAGTENIDVVNYHCYGTLELCGTFRSTLKSSMESNGLTDKKVWLTETGTSSAATSQEQQASDVVTYLLSAYAAGNELVMWHSYMSSPDATSKWYGYGLMDEYGNKKKSYYAYKMFAQKLVPLMNGVKVIKNDGKQYIYKVSAQDGVTRFVMWGTGEAAVPKGMQHATVVVPDSNGVFTTTDVHYGQTLTLTSQPVMLE